MNNQLFIYRLEPVNRSPGRTTNTLDSKYCKPECRPPPFTTKRKGREGFWDLKQVSFSLEHKKEGGRKGRWERKEEKRIRGQKKNKWVVNIFCKSLKMWSKEGLLIGCFDLVRPDRDGGPSIVRSENNTFQSIKVPLFCFSPGYRG